jgi:hypothetical protein
MKKLILLSGFYCLQPHVHAASNISFVKAHGIIVKNDMGTTRARDRAQAHLRERFPDVTKALWSTNSDNSINCYFRQREKVYRVYYDRRGNWTYTMISYPPSLLSNSIKYRVLENFDGYNISYVNEILSENNESVYMINIENAENIKVIRVSNNEEIEVKQNLQKN